MTPEEVLKEYGITAKTKHHDYTYLYNSVVAAMKDAAEKRDQQWKAKLEELIQKWTKRENEIEDVYKAAELSRCAADLESLLEAKQIND